MRKRQRVYFSALSRMVLQCVKEHDRRARIIACSNEKLGSVRYGNVDALSPGRPDVSRIVTYVWLAGLAGSTLRRRFRYVVVMWEVDAGGKVKEPAMVGREIHIGGGPIHLLEMLGNEVRSFRKYP